MIHFFNTNGNFNILNVSAKLVFGLSSGQLYFILVLLQLTILTPFLIKTIGTSRKAKYLFLLTPVYLLVLYVYALIYKEQVPFYNIPFPAWFIFYYFGLWVKLKGCKSILKRNSIINAILLCMIALILSIIEGYLLISRGVSVGFASSQIKLSSFLYVFAIINLLMVIKPYMNNMTISWLKNIGDSSYGIYYIHIFWIIISYKILPLIPVVGKILPIYQLLQMTFTIVLSYLSIVLTKELIGEKLSNKYLGF